MILIPLLQFDFQHNQWSYHTSNKKALITFFFSRNAILIIIRRVFVIACLFCSVDFRCGSSRSGSKIRLWFCFFVVSLPLDYSISDFIVLVYFDRKVKSETALIWIDRQISIQRKRNTNMSYLLNSMSNVGWSWSMFHQFTYI